MLKLDRELIWQLAESAGITDAPAYNIEKFAEAVRREVLEYVIAEFENVKLPRAGLYDNVEVYEEGFFDGVDRSRRAMENLL
jgi:hypothetical protein